jgi:hypothetical protein
VPEGEASGFSTRVRVRGLMAAPMREVDWARVGDYRQRGDDRGEARPGTEGWHRVRGSGVVVVSVTCEM